VFLKKKLRVILEDPASRGFLMVNDILAAFTILSVISIVLETVPAFVHLKPLFDTVEYTTVAVFTLEYFARMYAAPRKRDYIFGFFGIIDLLAIAPTYLTLANFTFLKTARVLRILRFLRAIRLAKIAELRTFSEVENNASLYWLNIGIYFLALMCVVLFLGGLMYVVEEGNADFSSIPLGMLWATKVVLGGLGGSTIAQVPATALGEGVAIFTRFCGLLLLGLLIHVVGNVIRLGLLGKTRKK